MAFFNRSTPEQRFWKWFAQNSERLFRFEANQDAVFNDLNTALSSVRNGLTFEFGPVDGGRREFIISADGIEELFPAVRKLVAAAPTMPEWEVVPFGPPKSLDLVVHFGPHRLGADDVWFTDESDGGRIGLHLFIRGLTEENEEAIGGAAFILLDNALGEYAVETQVGFIERLALPDRPEDHGLKPFRAIRTVFDRVQH